jgi:hypothetical protein
MTVTSETEGVVRWLTRGRTASTSTGGVLSARLWLTDTAGQPARTPGRATSGILGGLRRRQRPIFKGARLCVIVEGRRAAPHPTVEGGSA